MLCGNTGSCSRQEARMPVDPNSSQVPAVGLTRADLMTPDEVAALLAVPVSTVRDWARRGLIPSRKLGRHRRFLRSEIDGWIRRDAA
jgi:excisionase family DNA binding protein